MQKYIYSILFLILHQFAYNQVGEDDYLKELIDVESKSYSNSQNLRGVPQSVNYDLKYHRLEWEVNPDIYYIKGAITSYFVPVVAGFNEIYFDFSNALTIDSILYNGSALTYTQPINDVLQITFPAILPQNVVDSITVYYQGAPIATSGFGSFIQSSHNNDSIIWTLSEPYGALEWWPCKQDLNDKIDSIDVIVTTPKKNKVGSQGLLVNEITVGANKIYHWKHRYPIATYLISLAITNYVEFTDVATLSNGNLDILNYVYPEDSATLVTQSPRIIPIMELYDTLFGPYPFMNEKYGHAQFGWGGGMEHQTMSSMGNLGFGLMSHELAHQWFGDKVTCGSWKEIWLNEGFATYLTGISHKYLAPTWWWAWREGTLNDIIAQPDGSVYNPDTTDVSRIFDSRLTYKKGAYLLRMLEWKIGVNDFYQGVRNYLNDVNYAYGYAMTANLKMHLETISGLNLTEFFDDWYYGEGHPSYEVNWGQNGNNVTFTVNQSQSHSSVSFYEMPIPIYVKGQGQDTTYVFDHQFSGESFTATVPFTIDSVFFDPELWIISENPTVLSIDETDNSVSNLIIYPNPTESTFIIELPSTNSLEKVVLFDVLGSEVKVNIVAKNNSQFQLNISHLSKGTYVIEVHTDKAIIRKKIDKI